MNSGADTPQPFQGRTETTAGERKPLSGIRLPSELVKKIDYAAIDWDTFRSGAIERLVRAGLKHLRECEAKDGK